MPFLLKDEDEIKKQQEAGSNISGTSTTFNLPGANQSSSAKPEKKSGSWTNLNQYLDANKEQAGEMASKVVGDIDSSATDASTKLDQVKTSAPGSVQALSSQQVKDDYYATPDESKKDEYSTLKSTGGYSGPSDIYGITGFNDAEESVSKADQKLKQAQTEGGRQELLKSAYERPTYTQGQSTLDNLLVQNDAASKDKFNDIQTKWSGLTGMLDSAKTDIGNTIQSNLTTAQANKALLPVAEEEYVNDFLNPIVQRASDINANKTAYQDNLKTDLADTTLNEATMNLLGLTDGQKIFGLNLNDYMNYNQSDANADSVATNEERAKYAALMNLISRDPTDIGSSANSYNTASFDKSRFDTDLAAQQAEFDAFSGKTSVTGKGQSTNDGMPFTATKTGLLSDYLLNKAPTSDYVDGFSGRHFGSISGAGFENDADAKAYANYLAQIQKYLDQFNYNRSVKKG